MNRYKAHTHTLDRIENVEKSDTQVIIVLLCARCELVVVAKIKRKCVNAQGAHTHGENEKNKIEETYDKCFWFVTSCTTRWLAKNSRAVLTLVRSPILYFKVYLILMMLDVVLHYVVLFFLLLLAFRRTSAPGLHVFVCIYAQMLSIFCCWLRFVFLNLYIFLCLMCVVLRIKFASAFIVICSMVCSIFWWNTCCNIR